MRVHYGPLNKMIMSVRINGQPANLLVDTGSNEIILDTEAAETFGVAPSPRGLRYIGSTKINGQAVACWLYAKPYCWKHEFWQQPGRAARIHSYADATNVASMAFWALTFFFVTKR